MVGSKVNRMKTSRNGAGAKSAKARAVIPTNETLEVRTRLPYGRKFFWIKGEEAREVPREVAMHYIIEKYVPAEFKADFTLMLLPKLQRISKGGAR